MWHASLSLRIGGGPFPTGKWTRQQRREAERVAARLLAGVGQAPERGDVYPFSYQLRRCLTDAELVRLDPAWVAIPAVDEGGTPEEARAMLIELGMVGVAGGG